MARQKIKSVTADNSRLSKNVISFFLTCLVLSLAIGMSHGGGGFSNSLDKIKDNMKVVLDDLSNVLPNYTDYVDVHKYESGGVTFNPKGMDGLYNLTKMFMDLILPPDVLMKELIVIKQYGNYYYPELNEGVTVGEMLKYYWALLLVLLILVLITVLLPLIGLFFCCCRCCGNCGARTQPCDKRRDLCKKVCEGTLLIILGTGLLFCVVCAFASNQQIQEGTDDLPGNLRNSYNDSITYLDSTKDQARNLLTKNYKEFAIVFKDTVEKSGIHVMQQLNIWSNATAMMDLYNFVEAIPNITVQLGQLKGYTNNLRAMASQLNDAMRKVKRDLLNLLNNCSLDECVSIQKQISNLQTNIDFNRLPDVSPAIELLGKLNLNLLKTAAEEGKSKLDNIERHITSSLNDTLKQALSKVEHAGKKIQDNLNNILQTISDIQKQINSVDGTLEDGYRYLAYYSPYRYYGGLAISCILLLVVICILFGLICGVCGKRPDGYTDNCCNKGTGGQFLMCGVMIMFFCSLIIGAVILGALALGLVCDKGICHPLRNPQQSSILNIVDDYIVKNVKVNDMDIDISLSSVLTRCYKNESMYNVFNLEKKFNVDDIRKQFDVDSILGSIKNQLDRIVDPHFTILNNTNLNILKNLSSFDPGINFDHFQDELKENFTNMSLKKLSEVLQKLVEQMEGHHMLTSVQRGLNLSILHVNTYDEKILGPMKVKAKEVMDLALHLDSSLKMNCTTFKEAIEKLIHEIEDAQNKLRVDGSKMLIDAATSFGNIVKDQVQSYIERVIFVTKNKLGQCGPLNVAINTTLISTCDKILQPWNGFWLSLFASLVLFIPTIIVSVKLSSLYQKYKQYGQYVETGGKRGKKKKKVKKQEDRHQMGEMVVREYAAGSQPADSRYADMAPKHWEEFPNGGPPQYQRAPTEYERPPPYYYPGSGEQQ